MFNLVPFRKVSPNRFSDNPLQMMSDNFRNMFDTFFGDMPVPMVDTRDWPRAWGLELKEEDKEVLVRAELPGFEASELDVQLTENVLTVEGRHGEEGQDNFRHVRRTVTLPRALDVEHIDAKYRNGVLEVRIPRRPEAHGRKIEVKSENGSQQPA